MNDRREKDEDDPRATRVRGAFESFLGSHGARLDDRGRDLLSDVQDAVARKDRARLQERLAEARDRHGWLYQQLAAHPEIATLLDELALSGF